MIFKLFKYSPRKYEEYGGKFQYSMAKIVYTTRNTTRKTAQHKVFGTISIDFERKLLVSRGKRRLRLWANISAHQNESELVLIENSFANYLKTMSLYYVNREKNNLSFHVHCGFVLLNLFCQRHLFSIIIGRYARSVPNTFCKLWWEKKFIEPSFLEISDVDLLQGF